MKKNKTKIILGILICTIISMLLLLNISFATSGAVGQAVQTVINGNGTESNPYKLDFASAQTAANGNKYVEIQYDDVNKPSNSKDAKNDFYFKIINCPDGGGTFAVTPDTLKKTVRFERVNNNRFVYYDKQSNGNTYYAQAGSSPVLLKPKEYVKVDEKYCEFTIEAKEEAINKLGTLLSVDLVREVYEYKLINAPKNIGAYEQHPGMFVFAETESRNIDLYRNVAQHIVDYFVAENPHVTTFYPIITGDPIDGSIKTYAKYRVDCNILGYKPGNYNCDIGVVIGEVDDDSVAVTESNVKSEDAFTTSIVYHLKFKEVISGTEETDNPIEKAITNILIGLGRVLMWLVKLIMGSEMTMDSVIFNRYDLTTIDFRGNVGVFSKPEVVDVINIMYSGFEILAIVFNVIVFFYLAIQIILSVGTEKQSKWFKNLQNWFVGLLILFIAPRFFPYLTDISNAVVGFLSDYAKPQVTEYNIKAIIQNTEILGEDADSHSLEKQVKLAVEAKTIELNTLKTQMATYTTSADKIYNQDIWDTSNKINQGIFGGSTGYDWQLSHGYISAEEYARLKEEYNYADDAYLIAEYAKANKKYWNGNDEAEYEKLVSDFKNKWDNYSSAAWFQENHTNSQVFLNDYKTVQLQIGKLEEEIEILESYNGEDMMSKMSVMADKTGRVIYAIIYLFLFFQLISVVCMYYKRIIMVIILLMLFPVVMITYAIDKLGDGQAQTLSTWTKEFILNIIVQIAHAVIYVVLINAGLEIYEADSSLWFIFVLGVWCLFPMERLLREIFAMTGSTIGELKSNVAGGVALATGAAVAGIKAGKIAGKPIAAGAKGIANLAKDIKNDGLGKTIQSRRDKAKQKRDAKKAEKEEKKRRKKDPMARREDRERRREAKKDPEAVKRQQVADREKETRDRQIKMREEKAKARPFLSGYYKARNAMARARNAMYRVGNFGRKVKGLSHRLQNNFLGKTFKAGAKLMSSSAMLAAGAVNTLSEFGKHGLTGGANKAIVETKGALGALRAAKKKSNKSSGGSAKAGAGKTSGGGNVSGSGKSSVGKKRKLKGTKSYRKKVTDRKYIREE